MTDQLVEETAHVADAATALVGVTDEGLKGTQAGLGRVADSLSGLQVLATAIGTLTAVVGPKGEDGKDGTDGEQGPKGVTGPIGPRGPVGPKGSDGRSGTDGAAGKTGPAGMVGPKGPKGDRGPTGATGPQGDIGPAGKDGAPGLGGGTNGGGMVGMQIMDAGTPIASQAMTLDFADGLAVEMVNNKARVTATGGGPSSDDQTAAEVPFTPAGTIAATNVQAAIEEVAAEAGTGGGLPPQWTDGGNGDVTATTDNAGTPLKLVANVGQTAPLLRIHDAAEDVDGIVAYANTDKTQLRITAALGQLQADPLILVKDDLDGDLLVVNQEPGSLGASLSFGLGNAASDAFGGVLLDNHNEFQGAVLKLGVTEGGASAPDQVQLGAFVEFGVPSGIYTTLRLRAIATQLRPLLDMRDVTGAVVFALGPSGEVGFFDKAATPAAQQTIDAPNATPEQIANILIAYGLAVQSP